MYNSQAKAAVWQPNSTDGMAMHQDPAFPTGKVLLSPNMQRAPQYPDCSLTLSPQALEPEEALPFDT